MSRRTATILALTLAVVIAAVAAVGAGASSGSPTVKARTTSYGTILVDAKGHTLYLFEKDKRGKSSCAGACASNWPPLIAHGKPKAGGSARQGKLGTTKRSDGRTQVTYAGHPLYTFVLDGGKPGSTKGEGVEAFGAEWYVVGTPGKAIEKKRSSGY